MENIVNFENVRPLSATAKQILNKRYLWENEKTWDDLVHRVMNYIVPTDSADFAPTQEMIMHRYFVPNSPCLVNAGKEGAGLSACYVVDFQDTIEDILKTIGDFTYIARKGGGAGTTLSNLRPKGSNVRKSTHGYAGGPVAFANVISHMMGVISQGGLRSMAIMFTMSVYHPDIMEFILAKENEDDKKIENANMSVVVDNKFMELVYEDKTYWTEFNGVKYKEYRAKDIFNLIVDGAWRNGEPGLLFQDRINQSPYAYTGQKIQSTNPCLIGDTFVQTVEGEIKIKDLVGKTVDVYCMNTNGDITIGTASNIRKTKERAKIYNVVTSRGTVTCTQDHLFYTRNRGYVQAIDLKKSDKIVGLNRKMSSEQYVSVSLTGGEYVKEHRLIAGYYVDIIGKDVHHVDKNSLNNVRSNLEILEHSNHSIITDLGHSDWNERDEQGKYLPKSSLKARNVLHSDITNKVGTNLRLLRVELVNGLEDVYDLDVETYHNFIANGVVVHNCAEQPLPPNGVCNLGSIDISKFVNKDGTTDMEKLEYATRLGFRFLDKVIDKSHYPTDEIESWAIDNRAVGMGIMGFADYLLMRKLAYGSKESLLELDAILNRIQLWSIDESEKLGKKFGVPKECKKLPDPRRNITVTTVAPTGTVSLIAGCSSGLEPIFSEIVIRNDKTGTYIFEDKLADKPYFRCAVSSNGAMEVTWEEHVMVLATAQRNIDSGVSKTINFPNHTHRETIYKAMFMAWEMGCKGIAVYRNGSRKQEVLTVKNVKKDLCPICNTEMQMISGKFRCMNPNCNPYKEGDPIEQ